MAMLLGKKVGMTQVYDDLGKLVPVTVIQAGSCVVMQENTAETDNYNILFGSVSMRLSEYLFCLFRLFRLFFACNWPTYSLRYDLGKGFREQVHRSVRTFVELGGMMIVASHVEHRRYLTGIGSRWVQGFRKE